jgi:hypothetical protein
MPTISSDNNLVTTINVFTVPPERQQELLDRLIGLATQVARTVPGFLSATFHRSTDGARIVNYAQYNSSEAKDAVEARITEALSRLPSSSIELRKIVTTDFHTYEVVATVEGSALP